MSFWDDVGDVGKFGFQAYMGPAASYIGGQTPWGKSLGLDKGGLYGAGGPADISGSGKKNAPPSPDYRGAAEAQGQSSRDAINQQTGANRPNQSTPFGSSQWSQGPNGQWNQNVGFSGGMAQAANGLQNQLGQSLSHPLNFGGLGAVGTGEDARNQAITGAYNQATSRLDPMFAQQGEQLQSQLVNQGLDPNSQAAQAQMGNFGRMRNDAYGSAMNSAIGQGTAAGQAIFNQNMAGRQQGVNEMMMQRNAPLQELQGMQGFLNMPGFNAAGAAQPVNYLGAAQDQGNYNMQAWQAQNQAQGDMMGGLGSFAGAGAMAFSDERLKKNIHRLGVDAIPGVPMATFEFKHDPGKTHIGVIAQDLEQVAPQHVHTGPEGLKRVDYSAIPFSFK